MNHINVVKNFIEPEDINKLISFMDNNIEKFLIYQNNSRYVWRFGHDNFWEDCKKDLTPLLEIIDILEINIFNNILKKIKEFYNEELVISSFWLSKHEPGSRVPMHEDTDSGDNYHFSHSAVLYLTSLENEGIIDFPFVGFSYTPVAGELLLFPSKPIEFEHQFMHEVKEIKSTRYSIAIWAAPKEYSLYE